MSATILAAALALDAALGEPRWLWSRLPHPAVLMGRAVGWLDTHFNTGRNRRARGVAAMALLVVAAGVLGCVLALLPWWLQAVIAAILLAQRSLCDHVGDVARALDSSLPEGREAVARIVGRDTAQLDAPGVTRAAIESAAESLSDGVVAPALFLLVFGLPGLLVYKVTNTADSMVGYRTDRHEAFGWAAARFDDLLNLVPARLTAVLIFATHAHWQGWGAAIADARRHRSPNAGWPEAAMARVLGVALSGPRAYHGRLTDDPFVNPEGTREPGPEHIRIAVAGLWRAWAVMLGIALALSFA